MLLTVLFFFLFFSRTVEDQKAYLDSHYVGIGCGTPNRVAKLVENDALKLSSTALLVIDCQPNVKQQTIFDLPETKADLIAFIAAHCGERLASGEMKLAFV